MEKRFESPLHEANQPERKINYTNGKITVVWKPDLCTHSTRCFTQLPQVFNPRIKKWINVNGASEEKTIEQVKKCPSGALTYLLITMMDQNDSTKISENFKRDGKDQPIRFLVFSASLRTDSLNTRLANLAALAIEKNGDTVDFASMSEFDCPSYNHDNESKDIHPEAAIEFRKRLLVSDAFIISSPEYNGSIPDFLKIQLTGSHDFVHNHSMNIMLC